MPIQPIPPDLASDLGLSFFEDLQRNAARAAEVAGGWIERDLEPAGIGVRLRFAGPALAERLHLLKASLDQRRARREA